MGIQSPPLHCPLIQQAGADLGRLRFAGGDGFDSPCECDSVGVHAPGAFRHRIGGFGRLQQPLAEYPVRIQAQLPRRLRVFLFWPFQQQVQPHQVGVVGVGTGNQQTAPVFIRHVSVIGQLKAAAPMQHDALVAGRIGRVLLRRVGLRVGPPVAHLQHDLLGVVFIIAVCQHDSAEMQAGVLAQIYTEKVGVIRAMVIGQARISQRVNRQFRREPLCFAP